ncbi:hypothetical protein Javan139_0050 [Streptococcus phage Javan139]|nr:hypothetical protein Javan139_0050 [Streptococcus phage Javan139]SQB67338.1 Uncharacterised protein [Streptococcus dysgalactiae]
MKAFIEVKMTNTDEFEKLTDEFTQKARELEEIAHKLRTFHFTGEVSSSSTGDNEEELSIQTIDSNMLKTIGSAIHDTL